MVKIFGCKYCKTKGIRSVARTCIKTHILCDKDRRDKKHPPRNSSELFVSNITEAMTREEFK